jgi:hypothetical protein
MRMQVPAPAGTKSVSLAQHFVRCAPSQRVPPYFRAHVFPRCCRGFFSFFMVTLGSLLSALGRSFEATVVALFPSIFIPIMVGTWLAQGKAVPFGAVGPLTIGSLCTPFYRSNIACAFARVLSFAFLHSHRFDFTNAQRHQLLVVRRH